MMSKEEKATKKAKRLSFKRRTTMISAHNVAKLIVTMVGDYQIAMSIALKFVYKCKKEGNILHATDEARKAFTPKSVAGVPAWAIRKDFGHASADDILFFTINFETIKETDKAVQISFDTKNPHENGYVDHHKAWVAKSILVA